jgi:hypothetical protein
LRKPAKRGPPVSRILHRREVTPPPAVDILNTLHGLFADFCPKTRPCFSRHDKL